jgi:hypothetical protein
VETAIVAQELAEELELTVLRQRLDGALERYWKADNKDSSYKDTVARFRCDMSDLSLVREDMIQLAKLASTPHQDVENIDILNNLVEGSDTTVQCEDSTWSLHSFLLCGQSDYFQCALEGNFREAEESFVDLTHLLPCPEALLLAIQWLYADQLLEAEPPTLEIALWLLELGLAILCPRLVAYTTNTLLIPAVDVDSVFDMLELSKSHGLDKLEDRCVEVMAANLETVVYESDFRAILVREASEIAQSGDIRVTDVPIAAEIQSAISKQEYLTREERQQRLKLVRRVVAKALRT